MRARVPTVIKAFRAGETHHRPLRGVRRGLPPRGRRQPGFGPGVRLAAGRGGGRPPPPHRLGRPASRQRRRRRWRTCGPAGVDVSTGVESAPGRKDPLLVRDFIVNARRADGRHGGPRPAGGRRWPRSPTTGGTGERRGADGTAGTRRPLRRVRGPLRPRVVDAGLPRAREVVRRRLGRPGVPRRARRAAAPLRRPPDAGDRVPAPVGAPGRAGAAQAGGPGPHGLAQAQQRGGPGAAHPADGQDADDRRDRGGPARRGRRHGRRALRARVHGVHGRGRHEAPGAQRLPHGAARGRGAVGDARAAAR